MSNLLLILCFTFSNVFVAQERPVPVKKVYSMPGSYISPTEGVSWEIQDVYISAGMYQIKVNKENFPESLASNDTLYMPSWIAEQELFDAEGMDLSYIFIVEEKQITE
ncbi:MAG: hypothetical protein VX762_04935 [Bacteroidota bacterium]|nr:hypothetical protein [Bacteroidota bacterium]